MKFIFWNKYSDPELKRTLLRTGGQELIENTANAREETNRGSFWDNAPQRDGSGRFGHNWLGRLLMKERWEIKKTIWSAKMISSKKWKS